MRKKTHKITLTDRERHCLLLIARGMSTKGIAGDLGISDAGVNFHIQNALQKLSVKNRAHAVAVAIADGLIPVTAAVRGASLPEPDAEDQASPLAPDDDET